MAGMQTEEACRNAARARRRAVVSALLAACALLALAPIAAEASKTVLGTFCKEAGGTAGKCNTPTGVDVNRAGAGGVGVDEVYVADRGNNRVDEFTNVGEDKYSFVRAWGFNVVRTGPGNNTAVNEVQKATVKASSGTFRLSFTFDGSTQTTAPIASNATPSAVEAALQALSNVGAVGGTIAVTGGPGDPTGSTPYTLTFGGALAGTDLPLIAIDGGNLGQAAGTTLTCSSSTSATTTGFQWLRNGVPIGGATSSTYNLASPADDGASIQCQVFKLNANAGSTQVSNPQVVASPFPATVPPRPPATIVSPTVTGGTLTVGSNPAGAVKLSCAAGSWTGSPGFSYQWYRNGVALAGNGANTQEYTVQTVDLATAAVFQCAVTGTNAGGAATKVSQNRATTTAPSPAAPGGNTGSPEVSVAFPPSSTETTANGVDAAEICVAASGDVCQAGIRSAKAAAVRQPEAIAVDQATGNVYVAEEGEGGNRRVSVFTAKGAFEGALGWKVNATTPEAKLQFCTAATGCQAGESSPLAGGLSSLSHAGLAVDPGSGHLYVGERGNLRVDEFSPTLNGGNEVTAVSFVRAFGGDVISGGAAGTGSLSAGSKEVSGVKTTSRAFVAGQQISGEGIPAGTTIASVTLNEVIQSITLSNPVEAGKSGSNIPLTAAEGTGNVPRNERQSVAVTATGGSFKLNFRSNFPGEENITSAIAFDAGPAVVQSALAALANIGAGNVEVTGSPGSYAVEFKGTRFADTNVAQLKIETGSLTGGSASVATTVEGTSSEVCTTAAGCQAGSLEGRTDFCPGFGGGGCRPSTAGGVGGFFPSNTPTAIAVDSGGFVYAVTAEGTCSTTIPCRVQKFNPDGSFKENLGSSSGGAAQCQLTWTEGAANTRAAVGVAVNPADQHVFVTRKTSETGFELCEFASNGVLEDRSSGGSLITNATGYLVPAVASTGNVFVNAPVSGSQGAVYLLGPIPAPEADILSVTEIGATSARLNGRVTVPAPGGEGFDATYHFEYSGDNGLSWSSVPVPDASAGSVAGPHDVSQKATGLQPNLTYRVRLVACTAGCTTSGETTFHTLGAKPSISHTLALPVTGNTARLSGYVNPNNSATTYHFEWGTTAAYGNQLPGFEPFTGSGGEPVPVSANLSGLALSTTYHFRIVATNASGTEAGPDSVFTTNNFPANCPNEAFREQQHSTSLPDCRAYEQVSPADKRPVGAVEFFNVTELTYQASDDGERMYYPIANGLSDATKGGNVMYMAGREGDAGWLSTQLSAPVLVPSPEAERDAVSRVLYNSPELSCTILETPQPLTADTPPADLESGIFNLYRRSADGTHTLLTLPVPLNAAEIEGSSGDRYVVDWATSGCEQVLFESRYRLLLNAPPGGGNFLYEWANDTLRLAGVLPDDSVTPSASAHAGHLSWSGTPVYSISEDGSRVFFTAISNTGGDSGKRAIFVRKNHAATLDASQSATATPNNADSTIEQVSPDGSYVYFTARYGLAAGGSSKGLAACSQQLGNTPQGGEGCDLYRYDVDAETLSDLSVDTNPADSKGAGVIGMLDASDNGEYVYFAARGQLVPGQGRTQAQNVASSSYNVYLNHNGQFSFVGVIDGTQTTHAGSDNIAGDFDKWVADATPDGRRLLFVSTANVTGYVSGGVAEAYLYLSPADSTVCISCRADGLPSKGDANTAPIGYRQDLGWGGNNPVSHRPRAMSEDGRRVFFTMPDALAPGAVEGTHNLYEWEEGRVYLLFPGEGGSSRLTTFADSSADGNDVFFGTRAKLVPQDFDTTRDLYDVRVGGGFEYVAPPTVCDPLTTCQGPPPSPPAEGGAIGSEGAHGAGNPPIPRPKPHHKHRAKKHKSKRHGKKSHGKHRRGRHAGAEGRAGR